MIKDILHSAHTFLFPPFCFWCESEWALLCHSCHRDLHPHREICPACHRYSAYGKTCLNCYRSTHLDGVMIWFSYTESIKKIITSLKYAAHQDVAQFLATKLFYLFASTPLFNQQDIIVTYVPLHRWKKHMIRWYNQSHLLAQEFCSHAWLTLSKIFTKTRWTSSQTNFSRLKRGKNVASSFSLTTHHIKPYTTFLIVDDVTTTWSTLNQLASLIKQQEKTCRVYGLVVARNW